MYKTLLIGLLIANIGLTLFILYRKNRESKNESTPPPTASPMTPRPTIPNMKAVSLS